MDAETLLFINRHSSPVLDSVMIAVTTTGDVAAIILISLCILLVLYRHKQWRSMSFVLISIIGAFILNIILKMIFARQRPELWEHLIYESTYSFPSGHAMFTATVALCVGVLVWRRQHKWWIISALAAYVLAVGFSRMYLGVHYLSDILAGWLVAVIWVSATAYYVRTVNLRRKAIDKRG